MSFPGVEEKLSGDPSNVLTYKVMGKSFAYFKTSDPEKWRFSIRTTPERFVELTEFPGIKPARYMHRFHWLTIVKIETISDSNLKEWVTWSYQKAFQSLRKKDKILVSGKNA